MGVTAGGRAARNEKGLRSVMAPLAQCSATHAGSMVATCLCVDGLHHPTTGARKNFGETVRCLPFLSSSFPGGGYRLPLLVPTPLLGLFAVGERERKAVVINLSFPVNTERLTCVVRVK